MGTAGTGGSALPPPSFFLICQPPSFALISAFFTAGNAESKTSLKNRLFEQPNFETGVSLNLAETVPNIRN